MKKAVVVWIPPASPLGLSVGLKSVGVQSPGFMMVPSV